MQTREAYVSVEHLANVSACLQALVAGWRHYNLIMWRLGSSWFAELAALDSISDQSVPC